MYLVHGLNQAAADADFAWFERHGRRARIRLPMPGEQRPAPEGMVGATFALHLAPGYLVRLPIAVEAGIPLDRLGEADCYVVLDRLKQADGRLGQALAEAVRGRAVH